MQNSTRRLSLQQQLKRKEKRYHNVGKLRLTICLLCISTFYFGYCLAYLSTLSKHTMVSTFGELTQQSAISGLLIGMLTIGAAVGAVTSTFLMKCLSRRKLILVINIAALVVQGIIQYPNIYCLLACRAFQGFFVGVFMALVPIYINEISPKQIVGSFGVYTQMFVIMGLVWAFSLGLILTKSGVQSDIMWRIMFAFNAVIASTSIVCILFNIIPESPNSLLLSNQVEEAKTMIGYFYKEQFIEDVIREKMLEVEHERASEKATVKDYQDLSVKETSTQQIKTKGLSYSLKAYFLGFQLPFMQQVTGINAIVTQIGSVIQKHNPQFAQYTPLIMQVVQLVFTISLIGVISKIGRRSIILFGNMGLAFCDLSLGVLFLYISTWAPAFWLVFAILMLYMVIYGASIGPTIWLYVPEIIPAKIVPIATAFNWIGCSICIILLPVLNEHFGDFSTFFVFGGVTVITSIINLVMIPETKGLTTEEICEKLNQ